MSHDASDDKPTTGDKGSDPDKPRRRFSTRIGKGLEPRSDKAPYLERRRKKVREEIERNRRGEFVVPTWVLVVALIAVIAGWAALIFLP